MAELADLTVIQYPPKEGPTPCFTVVLQITASKVNQTGRAQYMGAMQHKDPLLCSMRALAQYLY